MISSRQLLFIVFLSRISVVTIFLPVVTSARALQDAWIAALLATVVGAVAVSLSVFLARRFPDEGYGSYVQRIMGAPVGKVLALVLASLYFGLALLRARQLGFLLITAQLEQAPGWVFAVTMIGAGLYGAYLGPDSLGRAAEVLVTVVAASILFGTIMVLVSAVPEVGYLMPVLARGWRPVAEATVNPVFWFAVSGSVVLVLGHRCLEQKDMLRAVVWAVILSGIVLTVIATLATVTFGPHEAQKQMSPMLSMSRTMFIKGALERLDALLISIWVGGVTFDTALYLMASFMILADVFNVRYGRLFLPLGLVGAVLASLRVADVFLIREILSPLPTGVALVVLQGVVVAFVLMMAVLRGLDDREE